jgi:hypothetical protein
VGFFKKIFKGVKKVFKKIGKGIKSAFKKVGKFMNKIGIIGQIGMMFILPGIGGALAKGFSSIAGAMAGYTGIGSSIISGAGKFLQAAYSRVGGLYNSITKGVTDVIGKTATNIASSLGVDPTSKTGQFLSNTLGVNVVEPGTARWGDVFDTAGKALSDIGQATTELVTGKTATITDQLASNVASMTPEQIEKARLDAIVSDSGGAFPTNLETGYQGIGPRQGNVLAPDAVQNALNVQPPTQTTSLLSPSGVTDAVQKVATTTEPKSLLQATIDAGRKVIEDIPGNVRASIEGAPEAIGEYIRETPKEFASRAGSGLITQGLQELGLVDEPIYNLNRTTVAVPSMLGTSASIGQNLDTGQPVAEFASVAGAYNKAVSNGFLYGDAAFVPDVYGSRMKEIYGMAA